MTQAIPILYTVESSVSQRLLHISRPVSEVGPARPPQCHWLVTSGPQPLPPDLPYTHVLLALQRKSALFVSPVTLKRPRLSSFEQTELLETTESDGRKGRAAGKEEILRGSDMRIPLLHTFS